MTEKVFQTVLGDVHYWAGGPGAGQPWLVFLPGLTADHCLFDEQVKAFASRYNCLVWDAPAHGSSRPFALKFTMHDLADYARGHLLTSPCPVSAIPGEVPAGQYAGNAGYPAPVGISVHK